MIRAAAISAERHWLLAGGLALAAHGGAAALALSWVRPAEPPIPEPVVLVELPPLPAAAPQALAMAQPQPVQQQQVVPQQATPVPVEAPVVRAPLPSDAVTLPPPPAPQPVRAAAAVPQPAPPAPVQQAQAGTGSVATPAPGNDARAQKAQADYFSLVSAHLNRRKVYPREARQARQQGVVTVRFTVDRNGGVSGVSIRKGSGHELLDQATLDLLQRVAPLPKMPDSMNRDSVTLSLPIDYSLRTS